MKKRIFTLFLALIMLASMLSVGVSAYNRPGYGDVEYFGWNVASSITDSGSARPFTNKDAYDAISACVSVYVGQVATDATEADIDAAVAAGTLEVMPIGGYYGRVGWTNYTPNLSDFTIDEVNEKGLVIVARQGLTFECSSICCNDYYGFNCQTAAAGNAGSFDDAIEAGATKILIITPDMLAGHGVYHQGRGQAWLMLSLGGSAEYNIIYNVRENADAEYAVDNTASLAVGAQIPAYTPAEIPAGYEFSGWYTDEALTQEWTKPNTMPANDIVVYGQLQPRTNLTYIVHYYIENTRIPVARDRIVTDQTYGTTVTETAVDVNYFVALEPTTQELTLTEDGMEITFYYTLTPPPIELEAGDHFNYIVGYTDGTVKPGAQITRAEIATIFFRLMTEESRDKFLTTENSFSDVPAGSWYNTAISTLANTGVLNGYPDGSFQPNKAITRGELAKVIALFADLQEGELQFTDISGHWAEPYILLAGGNGWVNGYPDGSFLPSRNITRAETMAMINRVLDRHVDDEKNLLEGMLTFSDNMDVSAWYYFDVQEATNYHHYVRVSEDSVSEEWLELLPNIDWTTYQY